MFAVHDLEPGTEVTVDYRHLLGPGQQEEFLDARSGKPIIGYDWSESLARSTAQLHAILTAIPAS